MSTTAAVPSIGRIVHVRSTNPSSPALECCMALVFDSGPGGLGVEVITRGGSHQQISLPLQQFEGEPDSWHWPQSCPDFDPTQTS